MCRLVSVLFYFIYSFICFGVLQVEKLDENEWSTKINQFKQGCQQELIVKRNFGRNGQNTLANIAQMQGLYL